MKIATTKAGINFLALFCLIFITAFFGTTAMSALRNLKQDVYSFEFVSLSHMEGQKELKCKASSKENSVFIPAINIEAPLVFPDEQDTELTDDLDRGVTHYPSSDLPGNKGTVIFLGHSAGPGWPHIKYDWVFSDLGDLKTGDKIHIFFNKCEYIYLVNGKYFIEQGENLPESLTNGKKSALILISCWPPGQNIRRIAVTAQLKK